VVGHGFTLTNIDITSRTYTGIVHNLEVEGAGTYVADGFLVHNCRCSFTALSREEAADEGIDAEGPDTEPDEGFGQAPDEKGTDWADPDDYAPPIGEVLEHVLDR
jgi:hypothetical protein